ncbi:SufD family Fe-S cluster assembly protein [Pseudofrancisella aestuarii]|uniref:SufD family Fe-S cluster assembly protein n=1 Tax=Pseudofrancisella aestuarii TaxID=2670347 RepID=A0ABV9T9N0_9GAMM|nr:SufD family Fe-S cluster assembly protein [Pseudofrancisella aestuarii]
MLIDKNMLPTTKQESWKYTNIASIYQKNNIDELLIESEATKDYLKNFKFDTNENVVIILDGVLAIDYNNKLNHISKLEFNEDNRDMSKIAKDNAKSFCINIPKDTKEDLSLIFINTEYAKNKLTNVALKLDVEMFSHVNLDIDYVNLTKSSALNLFLDIDIADSAKVTYTNNSDNANNKDFIITSNYLINFGENAEFNGFCILNKDHLLRKDIVVNLNESHSRFDLRGLYLLSDVACADVCCLVNHKASDTYSNVNFRGVVNGSSKAWFNAKAVVHEKIKGIQAYQNNKNVQLSKKAEINTKPELEILSDDVICTHGATIGELDKNALFYLQSRGLSLIEAQHILLESFIKSQITSEDLLLEDSQKADFLSSLEDILKSIL